MKKQFNGINAIILITMLVFINISKADIIDIANVSAACNNQQTPDGSCAYIGQAYYDMGQTSLGDMLDGVRFEKVQLPGGATINSAYLRLYADAGSTNGDPVTLIVAAESLKAEPVGGFGAGNNDIGGRPRLGTTVTWQINTAWTAGQMYQVDIAPILRYMLTANQWVRGLPINFIISKQSGTGWRRFCAYNGADSTRPRLYIDYTPPSRPNIAMGKTAVSSDIEGAYVASNAVDGFGDTRWGSLWNGAVNPDSAWIYVDLGRIYSIDSIFIYWQNSAARRYLIQISDNPTPNDNGWTTIADITDGVSSERRSIKLPNQVSTQYVRIRGISRILGYGYSIYEWEIYEATSDIIISQQPMSDTVAAGEQAIFSVSASGGSQISYQWRKSTDNGTTWQDISGATASTYSFTATSQDNNAKFQCKLTNNSGTRFTNVATLIICTPATITTQPTPSLQTIIAGNTVTYSVAASGSGGYFSYQWQQSKDGGTTWTNASGTGVNSATFTSNSLTPQDNNIKFRCVVSNNCGSPAVSNVVTVIVCTPPSISQQPSNWAGIAGSTASFYIVIPSEVTNPVFVWEKSIDNGNSWANIPNSNNSTYSFVTQASDNGLKLRCVVSGDCGTPAVSNIVTVSVCSPPTVVTNPQNLSVTEGSQASFSIVAGGGGTYTYQWQYSVDGGTGWSNVENATQSSLTFTANATQNGYKYRCLVWNGCGTDPAVSSAATLTVCTPAQIFSEPGNQDVNVGDTAIFSVTAVGTSVSYQWQKSLDGSSWTTPSVGVGINLATYKFKTTASDNNTKYRCIVQNTCGKDTSAVVNLIVCLPPVITLQPKDTEVISGTQATFTTIVNGTNIVYQWQRSNDGLLWAPISQEEKSSLTFTASQSDNGALFRCVITSKCGDIITSSATLNVCVPVKIVSQNISNKSVLVGTYVSYKITAEGTDLHYQWQKSTDGTNYSAITNANSDSISFTASKSDSGAYYRCVVFGRCGNAITSSAGRVLVYSPVKASFGVSTSSGVVPLNVTFSDSSTGDFTKRIWNLGNGVLDSNFSSNKSFTYSYTTANTYNVKLIVSGPGGTDSVSKQIFAYTLGSNPIQISGKYLTAKTVQITLSGYESIQPPTPFVKVDSIGLWYKVNALPSTPEQSTFIKWYTTTQLTSRGSNYTDTLVLSELSGSDSIYGIMSGILWSDKSISKFQSGNGTLILMRDTMPIPNELIISGVYIPDDTARIFLDNISSIDTSRVDSIYLWYSLVTNTPDFSDKSFTKALSAKDVAKTSGRYSLNIVNPAFNNVLDTVYAAAICVGKNKRKSVIQQTSFLVGKERPVNPIKLTAKYLSSTRIKLLWNNVSSTGIERIIIWYRTGSPIPLVYDVSSLKLDSLIPSVADTMIIGNKFTEKTRYYFGAQVYKNGLWSYITAASSATDSTPEAGAMLDSNTARISSLTFDSTTNNIKVCWTVNTAVAESLQLGILYSTQSMPTTMAGNPQVLDVTSASGCVNLKLNENLIFDTTYYITLWLRTPYGKWTPPIPQGMSSLRIPKFNWQTVTYFAKDKDTVYAFNNLIRLTNTPGDLSKTNNTVYYFMPQPEKLIGFVPVSIGFEFKSKEIGVPFFIGLKIFTDSIPKGYSIKDVRIYRQNVDGLWLLDMSSFSIDSINGYVQILTNNLDYPFIAMIDTVSPIAMVINPTNIPVGADAEIKDTIYIKDNISNIKWKLKSAKGGEAYITGDTTQFGTLSNLEDTIIVTIPRHLVNQDNGVRSIFIVSDGIHVDTINLSRQVIIEGSDVIWTEEQNWIPIYTTAELDTTDAKTRFKTLSENENEWKYDNIKHRIFRWYPNNFNATSNNKWVEYSDSISKEFDLVRGRVVWVKTKEKRPIKFGSGITASLKEPFSIKLLPKQWTDFAIPFKFKITVSDILSNTKSAMAQTNKLIADSLQLYVWKRDANGRYFSEAKFINTIIDPDLNNILQTCRFDSVYTIYNPSLDTLNLIVPPISEEISLGIAKRKFVKNGWSLKLVSSLENGTSLSSVYCGYLQDNKNFISYYPLPLSFAKAFVGIYDTISAKIYGHAVTHKLNNENGTSFMVAFCNMENIQNTFTTSIENLNLLPEGISFNIIDQEGKKVEFINSEKTKFKLTVEPNSQKILWLIVGTNSYLSKASTTFKAISLGLISVNPNPFKNFVKIKYSIPYTGTEKLQFAIYDLTGKTIWQKDITNFTKYGIQELIWNTRDTKGDKVASGIYLIRMTAFSNGKKKNGIFEKRLVILP